MSFADSKTKLAEKLDYGYRNREDALALRREILVSPSQNVLIGTTGRVKAADGYELDGNTDASGNGMGIRGKYDWINHLGQTRIMRSGFKTEFASDGKLQYRYVADGGEKLNGATLTAGQVVWVGLKNDLYGDALSFTTFWDFDTELMDLLLFVDGVSTDIYMWSGGVSKLASATVNSITGTFSVGTTWASSGFLTAGTRKVVINGTEYEYTGGEDTDTLTGVTTDASSEPVGSLVHQAVRTYANTDITDLPTAFVRGIISTLNNQVYVSSPYDHSVYISKVNDFTDFGFTNPGRVIGEGGVLTLDGVPTALIPTDDFMLISAGQNWWYRTDFVISSDNLKEAINVIPRKSTELQAAKSQNLTATIKNQVAFISQENQLNVFGSLENFSDAQIVDLSIPISTDMAALDFTGGSLKYHRNRLYLCAPASGTVMIYNMTKQGQSEWFWEAPQTLSFSCMSVIDGNIYGHGHSKGESYRAFYGNSHNGNSYICRAVFAYDAYGYRANRKTVSQLYAEGLKSRSTKLTETVRKAFGDSGSVFSWQVLPDRCAVVPVDDASIGKSSIGKSPIGTSGEAVDNMLRFRLIETFAPFSAFETQVEFSSEGIGQKWEIAAWGLDASLDSKEPTDIKDPNSGNL